MNNFCSHTEKWGKNHHERNDNDDGYFEYKGKWMKKKMISSEIDFFNKICVGINVWNFFIMHCKMIFIINNLFERVLLKISKKKYIFTKYVWFTL